MKISVFQKSGFSFFKGWHFFDYSVKKDFLFIETPSKSNGTSKACSRKYKQLNILDINYNFIAFKPKKNLKI